MPRHLSYWSIVLVCLFIGCAGLPFISKDDLIVGIQYYKEKNFPKAINRFNRVLKKDPSAIIAYRYLYLSYNAIKDEQKAIYCLMKQIQLKTTDVNVYRKCYSYFKKRNDTKKCFEILSAANSIIPNELDAFIVVTRENLAFFFAGASLQYKGGDAVLFAKKSGLMNPFPDGNFYPHDRITVGNFLLLLSKVLPDNGKYGIANQPTFKNIPPNSLYYLPASKLSHHKIIKPEEVKIPEEHISLTLAIDCLNRLKKTINF